MHSRMDRINELIGQKVSFILHNNILDPDQYFAVTQVETSPDLSYCDIEVSFLNSGNILIKILQDQHKHITTLLSKSLELRKIPKLRFHINKNSEHVAKIEELFKKLEL